MAKKAKRRKPHYKHPKHYEALKKNGHPKDTANKMPETEKPPFAIQTGQASQEIKRRVRGYFNLSVGDAHFTINLE